MSQEYNFDDIRPFTDEEAVAALSKVAQSPILGKISGYLFPDQPIDYLKELILNVKSVDDFQQEVMRRAVSSIMEKTSDGFTFDGLENLDSIRRGEKTILMSNHRDIVMDPALICYILAQSKLTINDICIGNNLFENDFVFALMRSNRMITVKRGITPRELFDASRELSAFIRYGDTRPVWLAQRQGRTKNGIDKTDRSLIKMLDQSGEGDFVDNFEFLHIVPVSISYEIESCDALKAREVILSAKGPYVKAKGEDFHSILTGIVSPKGRVHIHFGKCISRAELEKIAGQSSVRNVRLDALAELITSRIKSNYRIYPNSYVAYDVLHPEHHFNDKYTTVQAAAFLSRIDALCSGVSDVDSAELRSALLGIYSGCIDNA